MLDEPKAVENVPAEQVWQTAEEVPWPNAVPYVPEAQGVQAEMLSM